MELKKLSQNLDRTNNFKNISIKAGDFCLKEFDSEEITEDEEKCLKKHAINLHFIVSRGEIEKHILLGAPTKSW